MRKNQLEVAQTSKQKLEEIRARYNAVENMNPAAVVDYQEFARQAHRDRLDLLNYIDSLHAETTAPIPMVLQCPMCQTFHIDEPNEAKGWTNPPHRSHECQLCGCIWRPADVPTTGVLRTQTRGKADTWPRVLAVKVQTDQRYCPDGEPHRWADGRCCRPGCGALKAPALRAWTEEHRLLIERIFPENGHQRCACGLNMPHPYAAGVCAPDWRPKHEANPPPEYVLGYLNSGAPSPQKKLRRIRDRIHAYLAKHSAQAQPSSTKS